MHNQFLVKIFFAPFAVLILHIVATIFGWYELIWWLDKPLHLLGGVAIAASTYYLIEYFSHIQKLQINWKPLNLLAIFSVVALAAVSWEFMEFYFDRTINSDMQGGLYDTITDLIMGMLGGMLTALIFTYLLKKQPK